MTISCAQSGGSANLMGVRSRVQSCTTQLSRARCATWMMALMGAFIVSGCGGIQSTLDPAGREAKSIANLFWWMTAGAVIIWLAVILLTVYAARARSEARN